MEDDPEDRSFQELIAEAVEEISEEVEDEQLDDAIDELFGDLADSNYRGLQEAMDETLEEWRSHIRGFEDRLYNDWKDPIDLFEAFIIFTQELGQMYSNENQEDAIKEEDKIHLTLVKIHGRACQIAREILTLIKHGYADGAHARWRSIHEAAVVAAFIRSTGQDTAKRFMLHSAIDDYYQARAYRAHQSDLNVDPISDEEMDRIESRREKLLDHYGQDFDGLWGWASHELDSGKFKEMEQAAGLEHRRPYYVFASKVNIHSGSKGVFQQISTMDEYGRMNIAAPSNYGFALPATHTAISLHQITLSLLSHRPNEEHLVQIITSQNFIDDIMEEFDNVQREIEQREREGWEEVIDDLNEEELLEEYEREKAPILEIDLDDLGTEDHGGT